MRIKGLGKETTEYFQSEIENMIYPWQYKESEIHIINIDCVLSDIKTYWNEDIRFRKGFQINKDNSLNIPTIFVQINGIYKNKSEYRKLLEFMNTSNSIHFKNMKNMFQFEVNMYLKLQTFFDKNIEKMNYEARNEFLLKQEINSFSNVNLFAENLLYNKFENFIKKYPNLSNEVYVKILNLNNDILNLFQNFDFPFKNPKIIVENMENDDLSNENKYVLMFLYSLGFDIVIFSPKGLNFLKDYKINTITLDYYLNPNEKTYDYIEDNIIKKLNKKVKLLKKNQTIIFYPIIFILCYSLLFILLCFY